MEIVKLTCSLKEVLVYPTGNRAGSNEPSSRDRKIIFPFLPPEDREEMDLYQSEAASVCGLCFW